MNVFIMDRMNWPLFLNNILSDGMNLPMAYATILFIGFIALVSVAVMWQMLGDKQRPK